MDPAQCNTSSTTAAITINNTFREELLAAASAVTLVEPEEHLKLDSETSTIILSPKEASRFPLLELPNEVLLVILERLDTDSLYILAQLSRRLHHLALPIYLARKGMSPFEGELVLFDEHSEDISRALSIALFPRSLKRVYCSFNFYWPDRVVLRNAHRFLRLAEHLDVLHEAHLDFPNIRHFGPRVIELAFERYGECVAITDLEPVDVDWAQEFRVLFDTILSKGCTALTVCMSGLDELSTPRELAAVTPGPANLWWDGQRKFFQNLLPTKTFTRQTKLKTSYIPTKSSCTLSTLNLHSAILLQAALLPWTIRLLNSSAISTLSLKNLDIHPGSWSVILPCLNLPVLSNLSIDLCSIQYAELADFLERHPRIQHLYLGRTLPAPPDVPNTMSSEFLRNVTHLSAVPAYIKYLLHRTSSLRSLQSVVIIVRLRVGYPLDLSAIGKTLLPIAPRLPRREYTYNDHPLTLEISLESNPGTWALPAPDVHPTALMQQVSQLKLHIREYRLPEIAVARLPRWMGLFSSLKEVHLFCPSQNGPTELDQRLKFISSIFNRCTGLEKVGINGVVRDIDGWVVDTL